MTDTTSILVDTNIIEVLEGTSSYVVVGSTQEVIESTSTSVLVNTINTDISDVSEVLSLLLKGDPGEGIIPSILEYDISRPIAYVGFSNLIKRLDYSTLPPSVTTYVTNNLNIDWTNRASLTY